MDADNSIQMPEGQVGLMIQQEFEGPLPHPKTLAGYERIEPGTANRIICLAENEARHRHEMEHKMLDAEIAGNRKEASEVFIGQLFGFVIAISTIVGGVYTAVNGAEWPGAVIGSTGVTGLVSVFVLGRKSSKNEEKP